MKAPEGWSKKRLAEIAQLAGGTTPSRSQPEYWDGQYCWATPSDVTALSSGTMFIEDTSSKITDYALEGTSTKLYEPDTVMMTSRATIGYAVINEVPMATNQGFCNFTTGIELDDLFFAYWLRHKAPYLERLASGSTFKEISKKTLRSVEILLPPLPEQKKIAEILGSVDEALQATQETIEQTKRVKKGMLQELLTRGIGHTRFKKTEIGEIPEEWEVQRLLDVADVVEGLVDPKLVQYRGMILIAPNHIESGSGRLIGTETAMEQGAISGKYLFQRGDVLYSKIRPYLQKAVFAVSEGLCSADMYALRAGSSVLPRYLLYLILSDTFTRFAISVSMRTGIPKINREEMGLFHFGLPPIEEQHRIVAIISSIDDHIQAEANCAKELERLKRGLMQDLLTGRKRVSIAE